MANDKRYISENNKSLVHVLLSNIMLDITHHNFGIELLYSLGFHVSNVS